MTRTLVTRLLTRWASRYLHFAVVLTLSNLLFHGCCRSDGPCSAPAKPISFYNLVQPHASSSETTAVVKSIDPSRVTLEDQTRSFALTIGDAHRVFSPGQTVRITTCPSWGVGNDPYVVVRDTNLNLLLASSGSGAAALHTSCVPAEFTVESIDHQCCGIDDDCGHDVPVELRFRGDTEVLLSSGQQGTLNYHATRYAVINAMSTIRGSTEDCFDIGPNRASYVVYRMP